MNNIQLYIGDKKVDLSEDIDILFNWEMTDLNNPILIKNQGYSKTVILEGTNTNNEIFGHFWNLERYQGYGGNTGVDFNPSYRVPFTLYYNSAIYENGYVKLQRVITKNGVHQYEVGLFGGLGGFFYNLQTDWNTGDKKSLADLKYIDHSHSTEGWDIDFTINKETVETAWDNVGSEGNRYGLINFAPTYAGLPEGVDSDKVLINFSGLSLTQTSGNCSTYNGYALGHLPDNLTMDEVKDYRSYLQTPVIRVKKVIEAICRKDNNKGKYDNGYDVELDPDFFCSTNPYYEKAWMTLNSLTFENNEGVQSSIDLGDLTAVNRYYGRSTDLNMAYAIDSSGKTGTINGTMKLRISVPGATANYLHMTFVRRTLFNMFKHYESIAIQAYTTDSMTENENIFTSSKVQWLSETNTFTDKYFSYGDYGTTFPFIDVDLMGFTEYDGRLKKISTGVYEYEKEISFSVNFPESARYLKLRLMPCWVSDVGAHASRNVLCDTQDYSEDSQWHLYDYYSSSLSPYDKDFILNIYNDSSWGSNKVITKEKLLSTSFSPAEFLVNYCKQFGLYIYKDTAEDKIYIQTRNNFFKKQDIKNLEDIIDVSKDVEINPTYVDTNYVSLTATGVEGASYKDYSNKYGKKFGQKIIDTGYEFNADTKELIEAPFKNAIQTREKSLYFFQKNNGLNPYVYNGFSYNLYENGNYEGETITIEVPKKEITSSFQPLYEDKLYYDVIGKPQFEDASHKGDSTEGVFLFFTGYQDVSGKGYYLTDDNSYMAFLNNNPCWLMTNSEYDRNGQKIATEITRFPRFSRYYEGNHWMVYSWDFGSPRELYIPDMVNNDEVNIYSLYFKKYYEDLYDINTKVLTCYVNANNLSVETMKSIFWFRNGLWRLNKVYDYNPATPETTKVEFIKIQDVDSLSNEDATTVRWLKIYLDKYEIGQSGGTIVGTVITSDRYPWQISNISIEPSSPSPRGPVSVVSYDGNNFILSVSGNIRDDREVTIKAVSPDPEGGTNNASGKTEFIQPGVEYTFGINPNSITGGTLQYAENINITNPYYYDWSITSKPAWVTASPTGITNGQYGETGDTACTLTAAKNTTEVERTGTVVLTESTYNHTYSISVWQAGYVFSISPDSLSFDKSGGTATVTITNPYGYSWIVDSKPEWITTARTSSGNLTVTADPNIVFERTGTLVIKDTDFNHTYSVSITQESGYVFSIDPTYFYFLCDYELEDTLTIENPNHMAWTITNIPSWLTVSPTAGTGTSVSITADENIGFERSYSGISVNETLCSQHYLFDVEQESGYYFELLPRTGLTYTSASTGQVMTVACKAYNWSITSKPNWITASQTSGFGETDVTLTASENIGYERSGIIKVKNTDYNLEYILNVSQESGYYFNVSPTSFAFNSAGTITSSPTALTIDNPRGYYWEIMDLPVWVNANQTTGDTSATVVLTGSVNGWDARTDTFDVYENTVSSQETTISCSQESGYTLSYSPTAFTLNCTSGSSILTINNPDNYNLTISSDRNWISVSPTALTSSSSVTISVTDNQSSTDDRTGTITITNSSRNKTHTLNLMQAGYLFRVEPTSADTLTFASGGSTEFIMIFDGNNFNWEVTSYPSWLTPNVTTGNTTRSVEFTAATNAGRPERTGVIIVRDNVFNIDYTVNVAQLSGYEFSVSPTSFSFDSAGTAQQFTITNPYGYSWQITNPLGWLSFSQTAGTSNATVTVTAAANGWDVRTGKFYVEETTYGGGAEMNVSQASGYQFSYSPSEFEFNCKAGSSTLTINNPFGYRWSITNVPSWLTVSPSTGVSSDSVTLTVQGNSSSDNRWQDITLNELSMSHSYSINVEQYGNEFEVTPSSLSFVSGGGSNNMYIYDADNLGWTISNKPNWITLSASAGTGNATITVTAQRNTSGERSGSLTITEQTFSGTTSMPLTQASGYEFSITPTSFTGLSATGGTVTATVNNPNGYSWELYSVPNWITPSVSAGTSSTSITFTYAANTYTDTRETESMGIAEITTGNYIELYFEQNGLLTPRIISITATEQDNPEPPTPTAATLTIINQMPYDTYGNWTTSGPSISGDIHSGETRTYYWSSSSFPFTITGWGPGTVSGGSPMSWYIVNKTHSGSMTITYQGGYYQGTGSMTVYEGDELWLTT